MEDLKRCDRKFVITRTKEGWDMAQFTENFNCSEEEFKNRLKQLYITMENADKDYSEILKRIEKNSKSKRSKNCKWKDYESPLQIAERRIREISVSVFPKELNGLTTNYSELMEYLDTVSAQMEVVLNKRQELSEAVKAGESEVKKLEKILQDKKDELAETRKQFVAKRTEYDYLSSVYKDGNQAAQKTLDRINELTKPIIYVYEDGTIELEKRGSVITLDETGSDEIYSEMIGKFDDYRGRDIRIVARLKAIIKNYGEDVTLIIDGEEIENLYNLSK